MGERAAFRKDIFIVDRLPLTDVGKPMKNALRNDAAERVFRSVLSEATELSAADGRLTVSVQPHSASGTMATICVACPPDQRDKLEACVKGVMEKYTIAHRIEWISQDRPPGTTDRAERSCAE